jgi:cell division septation protein DedD
MEQFDDRNVNRMKEKNVYLLHLDAPRIIIISCVLVGVLIVAFLIGMNLSTDGRQDTRTVAQREMLFNPVPDEPLRDQNELQALDPPGEHEGAAPAGNAVIPQKDGQKQATAELPGNAVAANKSAAIDQPEKETRDVLTQDNIKEIIPPANTVKREKKERVAAARTKNDRREPAARKETRQKSHRTVEVASKTERPERTGPGGYSIQVSAFDNRATAQREVAKLKEHRYDPYIENTRIEGKKFYRVRIGPISSRKEAVKLLEEIQEMNRYGNSYITRD